MDLQLSSYHQTLKDTWVKEVDHQLIGRKTTVCVLTMDNGFEVVGTSACVDPENYDPLIGYHYALEDALKNLDGYVGVLLQQARHDDNFFKEEN